MKENKNIEELFSEKFQNFEAPVNPEIWANVAKGIGTAATTATSGLSVVAKIIIAATTISAIGVGAFVVFNNSFNESVIVENTTERPTDGKQEESPVVQQDLSTGIQTDSVSDKPVNVAPNVVNHEVRSEETNAAPSWIEESNNGGPQEDFVDLNELANELSENTSSTVAETKEPLVGESASSSVDNSETVQTTTIKEDITLVNLERETKEVFLEKLPNVLSPNNHLVFKTKNISYFKIEVFSVQGKLVFQSEDPNMIWDANDVPAGNYVYQIELKDMEGNYLKPRVERLQIIK